MWREPGLTFEGALRILGRNDLPGIKKLDKVLGGVILAAGVGAGIATVGPAVLAPLKMFAAVWGWLEQKDAAVGLLRGAIAGLSGKLAGTRGRERRELIAAAHTVIVIAAFFEAFREHAGKEFYDRLEITEEEKKALIAPRGDRLEGSLYEALYAAEIPGPSAAIGFEENVKDVGTWLEAFGSRVNTFISGLAAGENAIPDWALVVSGATERYRSRLLELAAHGPGVMMGGMRNQAAGPRAGGARWAADQAGQADALLADSAAARSMIADLRGDMAAALDADRAALGRLTALLALDAGQHGRTVPDLRQSLAWSNSGVLAEKIVPEDAQSYAGIEFPTVEESYVNPRYRVVRASMTWLITRLFPSIGMRPADERWWTTQAPQNDFDLMLAAYVASPDATRLPMLLLGHPGAGKSMLTKVLAARLPDSAYTVVRVPLRRVGANAPVRKQIEQALAEATNGRVDSWWQLAEQSQDTIRIILLDGLDELLQASQDDRTGYLQDVMEFQQREAEQRRPVVVIVTSRTVVADRVDIPDETTIVKLDFFDEPDIAEWLDKWRRVNAQAISSGTMRALTAQSVVGTPAAKEGVAAPAANRWDASGGDDAPVGRGGVRELARQPLLLLMLALYGADPESPPLDPDLASAELYQRLIETFCRREAVKVLGPHPARDEVETRMRDHLDRLEIAALAMFNRGRQDIGEEELGADLSVLDPRLMERSRPRQVGQRIIGEFLFVHAPEARLVGGRDAAGAAPDASRPTLRAPPRRRDEFLPSTFGEYLVAPRVMSGLVEAAARSFAGRRRPTAPDDDLLYALLSHQALAARKATLTFSGEIFDRMADSDREQVLAVLELLLGGCRRRQGTPAYTAYRPRVADTVRELAFYSPNLVALGTCLEPGHADIPQAQQDGRTAAPTRGTPDALLEQWRSMVMLWKSGLDADCMQAMLTTVGFSDGEPGILVSGFANTAVAWGALDPHFIIFEILLARLTNDLELAERIRYGAVIRNNHLITLTGTPWKDEIESWLIPMIAGNQRINLLLTDPPEGTSDEDVAYIADLIFRYLRSERGDDAAAENLLRLLFRLPGTFEADTLALTAAVLRDPVLLSQIPQLRAIGIYGPYSKFLQGILPGADEAEISEEAAATGQAIIRKFVSDRDSRLLWSYETGEE